ncbi:MAG: hypothetical protein VYA34_14030 [Myxococcota bacterium]|nr:hypothetical protein [Myxococcota bacterium]
MFRLLHHTLFAFVLVTFVSGCINAPPLPPQSQTTESSGNVDLPTNSEEASDNLATHFPSTEETEANTHATETTDTNTDITETEAATSETNSETTTPDPTEDDPAESENEQPTEPKSSDTSAEQSPPPTDSPEEEEEEEPVDTHHPEDGSEQPTQQATSPEDEEAVESESDPTPTPLVSLALIDRNTSSDTYEQDVQATDFRSKISAWYFFNAG